jgi:hypothetical protein
METKGHGAKETGGGMAIMRRKGGREARHARSGRSRAMQLGQLRRQAKFSLDRVKGVGVVLADSETLKPDFTIRKLPTFGIAAETGYRPSLPDPARGVYADRS